MELTKKQEMELLRILDSLEEARDYLMREDIQIFRMSDLRGDKIPGRWYSQSHPGKEIDGPYLKFTGSELARLPTAINSLREFIIENRPKSKGNIVKSYI